MPYFLGADLGTAYTAAAVYRDGRTETVDLGNRTAMIPSVVFLREDETILAGDAAVRRGAAEPDRMAREFKRRIGDPTPLVLGGSPFGAEALTGRLLRWVVDAVTEREGGPPAGIALAHPANWGPYKQDLLRDAVVRAQLDDVVTITEPEAAVTWYASQERIDPGSVIAVYDLGGGTFDAAVVRKTAGGTEVLGTPEGIERLGGVDFDEAVLAHVLSALGDAVGGLDPDDPATTAALVRLRSECVDAKEALSADTEVTIHVLLPSVATDVRLTRAEFEAMIRPSLADTLTALHRALRAAEVDPAELRSVLLAGGSSRIPLVAELVGGELGRPVAVDAHPKHGVALGAAQAAARAAGEAPAPPPRPAAPHAATSLSVAAAGAAAGASLAAGAVGGQAGDGRGATGGEGPTDLPGGSDGAGGADHAGAPREAEPATTAAMVAEPGIDSAAPMGMGAAPGYQPDARTEVISTPPTPTGEWGDPSATGTAYEGFRPPPRDGGDGASSRLPLLVAGAVAVLALVAAFVLLRDDGDAANTDDTTTTVGQGQVSSTEVTTATTGTPTSSASPATSRRTSTTAGTTTTEATTTTSSTTTTTSPDDTTTTAAETTTTTTP